MVFTVLHYIVLIRMNISINKKHISHVISYYIPPKCSEEKEPEDEQLCIPVCIHICRQLVIIHVHCWHIWSLYL